MSLKLYQRIDFFLLEIKNIISSLSMQISNCLEHWDVHDYQKNTFAKLGSPLNQ